MITDRLQYGFDSRVTRPRGDDDANRSGLGERERVGQRIDYAWRKCASFLAMNTSVLAMDSFVAPAICGVIRR